MLLAWFCWDTMDAAPAWGSRSITLIEEMNDEGVCEYGLHFPAFPPISLLNPHSNLTRKELVSPSFYR